MKIFRRQKKEKENPKGNEKFYTVCFMAVKLLKFVTSHTFRTNILATNLTVNFLEQQCLEVYFLCISRSLMQLIASPLLQQMSLQHPPAEITTQDDDSTLGGKKISSLCMVCEAAPKQYKCPRCDYFTCSLKCCKQHKLEVCGRNYGL